MISGKISEADRRAIAKYHKEKTKTFSVRLLKGADADIIEWLENHTNKVEITRQAFRMLMEKESNQGT